LGYLANVLSPCIKRETTQKRFVSDIELIWVVDRMVKYKIKYLGLNPSAGKDFSLQIFNHSIVPTDTGSAVLLFCNEGFG
jgi:hypothetical protein